MVLIIIIIKFCFCSRFIFSFDSCFVFPFQSSTHHFPLEPYLCNNFQSLHCLNELFMYPFWSDRAHCSLARVQQRARVWADVIVFVYGLVQVHRQPTDTDLHAAAVGRWHQGGHQWNIWGERGTHTSMSGSVLTFSFQGPPRLACIRLRPPQTPLTLRVHLVPNHESFSWVPPQVLKGVLLS